MSNPPALSGVDAPAEATLVISSSAMTFTLASVPSDVTNLKLVILASEGQSNGITCAFAKAAAFSDPSTPVAEAIDIKAAYEAQNGALTIATPKVFFRYFYVNTATGEKSGDVLVSGKLA